MIWPSLLLALSPPALAAETVQVTTPVGVTVNATKHVQPKSDTPEGLIFQSLKLITAGQFDSWIGAQCHPSLCPNDVAVINSLKNYNLKSSKKTGAACLQDNGTSIWVTAQKGDPSASETTLYIWCGEGRMPAPATVEKHDGKWKISSFSW